MRAKIPLPAFERKLRLLVGRGNERQMVEDRGDWTGRPIPEAFGDVDDSAWLLGLGYGKDSALEEGWEFDAGVHIRAHPDAILKSVYRHDFAYADDTVTRFRETFFWRASMGLGATTQVSLDHLLSERFMVRWANTGTVSQDATGLDWYSAVSLYQDLARQRGLAYTVYSRGRTAAPVPLEEYGVETSYRARFLRDWLFVELTTGVGWPRELETETRRANFGLGVQFDMYFGPVPAKDLR
jgi:hypothetical protein